MPPPPVRCSLVHTYTYIPHLDMNHDDRFRYLISPSSLLALRPPIPLPEAITDYLASKKEKFSFAALVKRKDGKKVDDRYLVVGKRRIYIFKSGGKVPCPFTSIVFWPLLWLSLFARVISSYSDPLLSLRPAFVCKYLRFKDL